jgi:hypothetical protein
MEINSQIGASLHAIASKVAGSEISGHTMTEPRYSPFRSDR